MSILSKIWSEILAVIYPPSCLVCREPIGLSESHICTSCFSKISYTRHWRYAENPMSQHVRDLQPFIENASAMFYYDSYCRDMIHRLKYRGEWHTARYLGELFGAYLSHSQIYSSIDVIIPVPIHPLRRLKRRYNQSEYIAQGMASRMGVKTNFRSLYRHRYTSAQAQRSRFDRWEDKDGIFRVRDIERLQGKHILLVDDVYTSGATIFMCAEAISRSVPNCRISVATIATSHAYGV